MVSVLPRGGVPPNPGASSAAAQSPAAAQADIMSAHTSECSGKGWKKSATGAPAGPSTRSSAGRPWCSSARCIWATSLESRPYTTCSEDGHEARPGGIDLVLDHHARPDAEAADLLRERERPEVRRRPGRAGVAEIPVGERQRGAARAVPAALGAVGEDLQRAGQAGHLVVHQGAAERDVLELAAVVATVEVPRGAQGATPGAGAERQRRAQADLLDVG